MKEINIVEGNKAIMQFEGWEETDSEVHRDYMIPPKELRSIKQPFHPRDAKYHSSWDWLMRVKNKIESMGYSIDISSDMRENIVDKYFCGVIMKNFVGTYLVQSQDSKEQINAVYKTMIKFIEWYNQTKK